jgi:hypothetical protein
VLGLAPNQETIHHRVSGVSGAHLISNTRHDRVGPVTSRVATVQVAVPPAITMCSIKKPAQMFIGFVSRAELDWLHLYENIRLLCL